MLATNGQQMAHVSTELTRMNDTDGNRQGVDVATKLLYHRVVEPSLGTVNKLSSPRRGSSPTNRVPSPNRLYGQLSALKSRPKTKTLSTYSGLTAQQHYVQEEIVDVQQRSSSPVSHNSTTKMKQLSLPTPSRSTTPFLRAGSAKGIRSVPVCTERYLGTDIKSISHLRSKSTESIRGPCSFTDQVKRFDSERRALYKTRTLKRITEIYSHRLEQGYYMTGSGVGLTNKYHIDDTELDRLREFSRSKMALRTASATSQRLRSRASLTTPTSGFFVTQNKMGIDPISGMVISGHQINSTAPSDAGKTSIPTRSSSAVTERTHGMDGHRRTDGDNDDAVGKDSSGDVKETHGNDQEGANAGNTVSTEEHEGTDTSTDNDVKTPANQNISTEGSTKIDRNEETISSSNAIHNGEACTGNHGDVDHVSSNQADADIHEGESNHGTAGSIHGDGETGDIGNNLGGLMHGNNTEGDHEGHAGGSRGGGDAEDLHRSRGSGAGPDDCNHGDNAGDQNGKGSTGGAGYVSNSTNEGVLQINLTDGITLISKASDISRSKEDVYMTEFTNPNIDGLRSEMEVMQRNKVFNRDDEDDSDDDDKALATDDIDTNNEQNRYQLNTRDSEISIMEDKLDRVKLLEVDMSCVGHLTESREDLRALHNEEEAAKKVAENVASGEYDGDVFAQVKNDEELKEAEERKEGKKRLRTPYRPSVKEGNTGKKMETKPAYRFHLSDMYKFINSRQKAIFEEKFEELDTDSNGKVTLKEIKKKMKTSKAPKEQIKKFLQVFDLNKDKTIDKKEFVTVAALNDKLTRHETQSNAEPLRLDLDTLAFNIQAYTEMFQVTDRNGDGRLNLEEIMLIVALSVGVDIGSDLEVVKHIHTTIDSDNNGSIDFIEFLSYIPFFLKLHHQILGRPATIQEIEDARFAVKKVVLKVGVR